MDAPLRWPLPAHGETAAFSHLRRTRQALAPHAHGDHQLVIPLRGRLVFRIAGARITVEEPQALFLRAGTPHALEAPAGAVDLFAVQVAPAALDAAARACGTLVPDAEHLMLTRVTPLLRELGQQLVSFADALKAGRAQSALAAITYPHFCLALADRLAREVGAGRATEELPARFRSEYVDRAVAYLTANVTEAPSLPELARRVGTSPRNLTREFQREVGTSPVRFASRLRLEEAARRLQATDAPVKDVALSLGFGSVPRFNTAFRALHGCTPLEYRRRRG